MKQQYLFITTFEDYANVKLCSDLNEFHEFCNFQGLISDWNECKKIIRKALQAHGIFIFKGNQVHYFIIQHPMWKYYKATLWHDWRELES